MRDRYLSLLSVKMFSVEYDGNMNMLMLKIKTDASVLNSIETRKKPKVRSIRVMFYF